MFCIPCDTLRVTRCGMRGRRRGSWGLQKNLAGVPVPEVRKEFRLAGAGDQRMFLNITH